MFWETEFEKTSFQGGFRKQLSRLEDYLECELGIDTEDSAEPKNEQHKNLMYYLKQMQVTADYLDKGKALVDADLPERLHGEKILLEDLAKNWIQLEHVLLDHNVIESDRICSHCRKRQIFVLINPEEKDPDKLIAQCPDCGRQVHYV